MKGTPAAPRRRRPPRSHPALPFGHLFREPPTAPRPIYRRRRLARRCFTPSTSRRHDGVATSPRDTRPPARVDSREPMPMPPRHNRYSPEPMFSSGKEGDIRSVYDSFSPDDAAAEIPHGDAYFLPPDTFSPLVEIFLGKRPTPVLLPFIIFHYDIFIRGR